MKRGLIALAAIVMAGCGVLRKAQHGAPAETQHMDHRVITGGNIETKQSQSGEYMLLNEELNPAARIAPFSMSFSGIECQHVRAQGIANTLPDGGLAVPLEMLRSEFCYPVVGKLISDYGLRSGRQHTGIDIKATRGDTIRAAFPGVVRMSKLYSSYGNIVVIRHYAGFETVYSHNTQNLVAPNDVVKAGDPIALVGRTGRATTEHLHFEVRAGGAAIDPKLLVDHQQMSLRTGYLFVSKNGVVVTAANSESDLRIEEGRAADDIAAREEAMAQAIAHAESVSKVTPVASAPVYYTIKNGDVLGKIAASHGTTVSKICSLNGLKSPDRIRAGQRIRVK